MTEIVPNNSQVVKQPDDASSNLQSQSLHSPSSSTMTASMSQSATTATSNTNAVSASQAKAFSNSFWVIDIKMQFHILACGWTGL